MIPLSIKYSYKNFDIKKKRKKYKQAEKICEMYVIQIYCSLFNHLNVLKIIWDLFRH